MTGDTRRETTGDVAKFELRFGSVAGHPRRPLENALLLKVLPNFGH
jgi:hypothetical protein